MSLGCRQDGEPVAQVAPQLGELRLTVGWKSGRDPRVLLERRVQTLSASLCHIPASVDRQSVEPRRERRLASELSDLGAELREGILSRVASIFGVGKDVVGEPLDTWRVALAQRGESARVCIFGTTDEDRIAQSLVGELWLGPQHGTNSAARPLGGLHIASLLAAE